MIDISKELQIIKSNVDCVIADRYNTTEKEISNFLSELLMTNKPCRLVTNFKDHLIYNNREEYLRRCNNNKI